MNKVRGRFLAKAQSRKGHPEKGGCHLLPPRRWVPPIGLARFPPRRWVSPIAPRTPHAPPRAPCYTPQNVGATYYPPTYYPRCDYPKCGCHLLSLPPSTPPEDGCHLLPLLSLPPSTPPEDGCHLLPSIEPMNKVGGGFSPRRKVAKAIRKFV
jgi:hypothetical protein